MQVIKKRNSTSPLDFGNHDKEYFGLIDTFYTTEKPIKTSRILYSWGDVLDNPYNVKVVYENYDTEGAWRYKFNVTCPWTGIYTCYMNGRDAGEGVQKYLVDGTVYVFDFRLTTSKGDMFCYGVYSQEEHERMKLSIHDDSCFCSQGDTIYFSSVIRSGDGNNPPISADSYFTSMFAMNIHLICYHK